MQKYMIYRTVKLATARVESIANRYKKTRLRLPRDDLWRL